jgi:Holliday junction DNA helicase RuvB
MEYIGHEKTKTQIGIAMNSAIRRNTSIPHMLFAGAAGCGKTSMAKFISEQSKTNFISIPAEAFKDVKTIKIILEKLSHVGYNRHGDRIDIIKPSILFIDEIHNLSLSGQEILGIAMENFSMDSGIPNKKYWIPYFTLIGATTDDGILSKPFKDRFKLKFLFQPYEIEEMLLIVRIHVKKVDMLIDDEAISMIAIRSHGIPRIAVSYIDACRDYALAYNSKIITSNITMRMFSDRGIDNTGLSTVEIKILQTLYNNDIPVGLDNLSIIVNEAKKTIALSIEPLLLQRGLILRSGKGRIITDKGRKYLEENGHIDGKNSGIIKSDIPSYYIRK